jgi:beta-N-acetylhexosaminidase
MLLLFNNRNKMKFHRIFSIILLVSFAFSIQSTIDGQASTSFQDNDPSVKARQMLARMTSEERVGQLFLVTFNGSTADQSSQIYDLIANFHAGGVVLLANKDNFVATPDTVTSAYQLINQLQTAEWQASQPILVEVETGTPTPATTPTNTTETNSQNYIPLFIGISQDGDGYPNDQILNGLTPLPNSMALGATWEPALAEQVGAVAGQELSSIGFNLIFGPSLDVLESPGSTLGNGLGASAFGGDPYWVGAMGSAYISGLHTGSNGKLTVIADHFPGRGSADRPAGEEPATVRKSLEQLKQIELAPFFTVTGNASTPESTADGLLVSHIRYQGFQGNIRSTTRPVSFDSQALSQILSLPAFASWRTAGGLMVSDDLGSQTVRSFYDPSGQSFLARLVARDAFLAGNDLLYMGDIISSDAPDNYSTVVRAIEFFNQKYREDPAFAQGIDDAVVRILTAKYRTLGDFDPAEIIPISDELVLPEQLQTITFEVARKSATLVSPNITDLDAVLPSPPVLRERIVFLTDTRGGSQCSTCGEESMLPVKALQDVIVRLYGPQAGGQVQENRLVSYPLTSLNSILDGAGGDPSLEGSLRQAEWVVINMLDAEPDEPQTILLRRFLSERQDLLLDKRIIVFAFNAPYFLDATDISKLTAYYCLYSKSAPFVEVAARLLFRELSPAGSLPVSVAGIGYDLFTATTPDPNQVIGLSMDISSLSASTTSVTPEATPTTPFKVGDTVSVRTSIILDQNGHPVPDGTGVRFNISLSGEGGVVQQIDAVTIQGLAGASFSIARPGLIEIRAESDPAFSSVVLQLDVSGESFSVTVLAPTPINTMTPKPVVLVTPDVEIIAPLAKGYPGFGGWFGMMITLGGLGMIVYSVALRYISMRWAVRWVLCIVAGGLLAYTYLALQLPGAGGFLQRNGWLGIIGVVILGVAVGFGSAFSWWRLSTGSSRPPD